MGWPPSAGVGSHIRAGRSRPRRCSSAHSRKRHKRRESAPRETCQNLRCHRAFCRNWPVHVGVCARRKGIHRRRGHVAHWNRIAGMAAPACGANRRASVRTRQASCHSLASWPAESPPRCLRCSRRAYQPDLTPVQAAQWLHPVPAIFSPTKEIAMIDSRGNVHAHRMFIARSPPLQLVRARLVLGASRRRAR